jgi:hypothetical protein
LPGGPAQPIVRRLYEKINRRDFAEVTASSRPVIWDTATPEQFAAFIRDNFQLKRAS